MSPMERRACSQCKTPVPCPAVRQCPEHGAFIETAAQVGAHDAALKADAERLAELREEHRAQWNRVPDPLAWEDFRKRESLIAVYEECAARGRTLGGLG